MNQMACVRLRNATIHARAKLAKAPILGLTGRANTQQLTMLGGGVVEKGGWEGTDAHISLEKPISHSSLCNLYDIGFWREIYPGIHLSGSESIYNCFPHRTASLFCVDILSQLVRLLVVPRPRYVESL